MPIWCSFFRLWTDECVQVDAVTRCGRDAGALEAGRGQSRRKTQASWRQDAGTLEAGRGHSGGRTWAEQTQDAGVLEAGRGHSGGRTWAEQTQDAGVLEAGRGQCGHKTWAEWTQFVISWQYFITKNNKNTNFTSKLIHFGSIQYNHLPNQTAEYDSFRRDLGCARQNLRCASVQT